MEVTQLIEKLKKADESAFKELVFTYSGKLLTVARIYSKTNEDAKDMLQEAFIIIFKKVENFSSDSEKAFFAWMKTIIINLCLSRSQRKYLKLEKSIDALVIEQSIDPKVISHMSHQEIMNIVFSLPDGYRQVFALYAIEGYSHKEIATALSIAESSSRSQLLRARRLLQNKLTNLFKVQTA